jgi:hypothetical protein
MSSQIDFRTLPSNVPILCIPRVYPNIHEKRIRGIFNDLNMGELERIDIVSKTSEKGERFNRVFVHFKRWNDSENANTTRERLLNGKEIKIVYDDPWFWKISAYRESERKYVPQKTYSNGGVRNKATITFDMSNKHTSVEDHSKAVNSSDAAYRPQRRSDSRERPQQRHPPRTNHSQQRRYLDTTTPYSSPVRNRPENVSNVVTPIDYGEFNIPVRKPIFSVKKEKCEVEEGEVEE